MMTSLLPCRTSCHLLVVVGLMAVALEAGSAAAVSQSSNTCANFTEQPTRAIDQEQPHIYNLSTLSNRTDSRAEIDIQANLSNSFKNKTSSIQQAATENDSLYKTISFYAYGVITPVVLLVGICGNIIILTVLVRGALISTATVYLVAISVSDLLYMSMAAPIVFSAYETLSGSAGYKSFYAHFVVYLVPLIQVFYSASTWCTVCFSIERYIAICHPMKAKTLHTPSRSRIAVCCVYVLSFAISGSHWLSRKLELVTDAANNETYYAYKQSELGSSATYLSFRYWLSFVWLTGFPLSLLAFLNISIVAKVKSASEGRKKLSNEEGQTTTSKSRDRQLTRLLLGIVLVHFSCSVTSAACSLAVGIAGRGVYASMVYRTIRIFADVLVQANPVFNFVFYASCSKVMRTAIKELLVPKCLIRSAESNSTETCHARQFPTKA